jgi:hypothetical protein
VTIWHDIAPEGKTEFYEWHNREHMPERVGIPGFRRGRRYIAEQGTPEYFTLYEVERPEVLTGREYLNRLNSPTPRTRRALTHFRSVSRCLCRVGASYGYAQGGVIMTWRLEASSGREEELRRYLARTALAAVLERVGVVGAHFGTADRAGSEILTEEKKARGSVTRVPGWVILVEGVSASGIESAAEPELATAALQGHGATDPIERSLYRLEVSHGKTAFATG